MGPAGLSLVCHVLILISLTFVTWAAGAAGEGKWTEFTAKVVTESRDSGPVGGFHFPGGAQIDRSDSVEPGESMQDLASLLEKEMSLQMSPTEMGTTGLSTIAVSALSRSDVVGTAVIEGGDEALQGSGLGDRDLAGGGPVGSLWGVGKGQKARSIVYVMDRSGSMNEAFDSLQQELKRAIGSLEPDQLFNVIWFNEGKADTWSTRMRKATFENKRAAFSAISVIVPAGQTEPMDAVIKGLGYQPDVLFLLSDGDFGEENKRIIDLFERRNRKKRTIVNTILFIYDTMGDGERVLRRIAEMNNGNYKHVTEEDAGRR